MDDERDGEAESGEDQIDERGRNPTQQRMDEEGLEDAPVDASWTGEGESSDQGAPVAAAGPAVAGGGFETSSQVGGSGGPAPADVVAGANEPTFEPDVPLVAEVNRGAGEASDRKKKLGVLGAAAALLTGVVLRRRRRR